MCVYIYIYTIGHEARVTPSLSNGKPNCAHKRLYIYKMQDSRAGYVKCVVCNTHGATPRNSAASAAAALASWSGNESGSKDWCRTQILGCTYIYIYLSLSPSVSLSLSPSLCLYISLYIYLYVYIYISLSLSLPLSLIRCIQGVFAVRGHLVSPT